VSWEEARLKQALPRVIGRCMSYSAATCFDEALVAAVRRFYGIDVDVATAETDILEDDFERVRFFPWFLWDFAPPSGVPIGQRFLAEGELSDYERGIVRALAGSSVAFVEVVETSPELGFLVLRDLRAGHPSEGHHGLGDIVVRDGGLATELAAGQVSLLRLVHLTNMTLPAEVGELEPGAKTFAMLDAIYAVLPPEARPLVETELAHMVHGLESSDAARLMKERAPELLDFAEHVLQKLTEPQTLMNVDGEPIVLCRTFLADAQGAASGTLPGSTASLFAPLEMGRVPPFVHDSRAVWDEEGRTIGWLRSAPGGWIVESSSRERFARVDEALGHLGVQLPALHSEEELARAVAQWLALGECEAWLTDHEVERAFRGQLGESLAQWPDQPHPALGRRTPREVKGEPGGEIVVARLLQRVRKVAGEAAGARLASLLA